MREGDGATPAKVGSGQVASLGGNNRRGQITRRTLSVLGTSVFALFLSVALAVAADVEYCGAGGVSRQILNRYDKQILIQSRDELLASEKRNLPYGFPACALRLFNPYYIDCYDVERRVPLWSAYELDRKDVVSGDKKERAARQKAKAAGKVYRRTESFRTDPRLQPDQSATCDEFKRQRALSGARNFLARGHSAPDADFRNDDRGRAYTYYLSNMTPQWQLFNGGIWARLEGYVRDWAKKYGEVHVISGAIFDKDEDGRPDQASVAARMPPADRVGVPTHYYKIVLRPTADGGIAAMAFLLPHWKDGHVPGTNDKPDEILTKSLVSIYDIRERVGVDLLPAINPESKDRLETSVASGLWPRK